MHERHGAEQAGEAADDEGGGVHLDALFLFLVCSPMLR